MKTLFHLTVIGIILVLLANQTSIAAETAINCSTMDAGTDIVVVNNHSDYPVIMMEALKNELTKWREQHPDRRLVSTDIFYKTTYRGDLVVVGILVHYEKSSPSSP